MPDPSKPVSVCIVTHEFAGLPGSGGIGTAFAGLAEALSAAGHAVTVLCTGLLPVPAGFETDSAAAKAGVTVVRLPDSPVRVEGDQFLRLSHDVFAWLAERRFDVVHFADWTGLGFCATAAKRQGLAFAGTTLAVGLHGPTRWVRSATGGGLEGSGELAIDFLERRSAEWADVVVSPSRYLLDWLRGAGWSLPARAEVRQNILPRPAGSAVFPPTAPRPMRELVFFGRLETRKGVTLFCDALDRLAAEGGFPDLGITFLGGSAPVDGEDGAAYVRRRARAWPWPVGFRHGLSSSEALDYLGGEGRLAVIPSRIENSPCTVAECLIRGLPFLASRVGGTAELIADEDAGRVLFVPEADALAARLGRTLRDGAASARLRVAQDAVAEEWRAWHAAEAAAPPAPGTELGTELGAERDPAAIGYTLIADPRLRLLDGAAGRMAAVAARTGAAVVTGAVDEAGGSRRWLAPGGPAALAAWGNVAGSGPLLVRRDLLDGAAQRNGWLTGLLLAGHRIEVMPVPVAAAVEPPAPATPAERLAPFLATGTDEAVADLARLAVGLDALAARMSAERSGLAAALEQARGEAQALRAERNRLAAALEGTAAPPDAAERTARLAGLLGSRSWSLSAPLRRRLGGVEDARLAGLPADRAAETMLTSVWWDLAAPWRLAARLWRWGRRRLRSSRA